MAIVVWDGSIVSSGNIEYMAVSLNGGTPKSSILIGFSIINHPFLETPKTLVLDSCLKASPTTCHLYQRISGCLPLNESEDFCDSLKPFVYLFDELDFINICKHTKPNNMNTTLELQVPSGRNQSSGFLNWKSLTLFTFGSFLWN